MAVTTNEKSILSDIQNRRFSPVYLLTSEDGYYLDLVSGYFEEHVVDIVSRDFDQTIVYGMDIDMPTVISYARQYPIMSPVKLVMVKEAQDIKTTSWNQLNEYLENPQPTTVLVFVYRNKLLEKTSKIHQSINSKGVVYEKRKLFNNQVPQWINQYVQENGYGITERAANLLSESIGTDLDKIANEIQKVFLVLEKGSVIDDDVVERYIGISKSYNISELQNAIAQRDVLRCNRFVNYFAANPKETPIQSIIPRLYTLIINTMIYLQAPNRNEAAAQLNLKPTSYSFIYSETAARNYTLGKLANCINYLYDADLRSKGVNCSSAVTQGELLKELIFKIIH